MVKRTSKRQVAEEVEAHRRLHEFRHTPRLLCIVFSHDDIEGPVRLRVSFNEEPPAHNVLCSTRDEVETMKAHFRVHSLDDFERAFSQFKRVNSPWGWGRREIGDLTADYFDSYAPETVGAANLEPVI